MCRIIGTVVMQVMPSRLHPCLHGFGLRRCWLLAVQQSGMKGQRLKLPPIEEFDSADEALELLAELSDYESESDGESCGASSEGLSRTTWSLGASPRLSLPNGSPRSSASNSTVDLQGALFTRYAWHLLPDLMIVRISRPLPAQNPFVLQEPSVSTLRYCERNWHNLT